MFLGIALIDPEEDNKWRKRRCKQNIVFVISVCLTFLYTYLAINDNWACYLLLPFIFGGGFWLSRS